MNEISKKLQQLAEEAAKEKAAADARPQIIAKATREYLNTQQQLEERINEFNANTDAQSLLLKLKLDRAIDRGDSVHYTLKLLRDGRSEKRSTVEIIMLPSIEYGFEEARIVVREWSSNYDIKCVTDVMNFVPGEEPKRLREAKFKLNIVDNTYGWILESAKSNVGMSFPELINSIIYERLVSQL